MKNNKKLSHKYYFENSENKNKVFFYHHDCIDGAAALWVAANKYKNKMSYVSLEHGAQEKIAEKIMNNIDKDSEIIFADFCPSPEIMINVLDVVSKGKGKIKVMDHHETAINQYKNFPKNEKLDLLFDANRAGGRIVYDEMMNNGNLTPDAELPKIIKISEIIDLNQTFQDNFSEISSYVDKYALPTPYRSYLVANMVDNTDIQIMKNKGAKFFNEETEKVSKLLDAKAHKIRLKMPNLFNNGVDMYVVPGNLRDFSRHFDNELMRRCKEKKCDIAISYFKENGAVKVSIRSPNPRIDLSVVGDYFASHGIAGGGRKTSAGATFTPDQFQSFFGFAPVSEKDEKVADIGFSNKGRFKDLISKLTKQAIHTVKDTPDIQFVQKIKEMAVAK